MHTEQRSVHTNGIELAYDTFGDPMDPPLLLIMGLGTQMIGWDDDFCAELAARGRHVVRFDNRDIGQSTKFGQLGVPDIGQAMQAALQGQPIKTPYLLNDMADDSGGLLDASRIGS